MQWLSNNPQLRRWVYGIALAVVPILTAYGLISEDLAPLWVSLISAVLVPSLALANTPGPAASGEGLDANQVEQVARFLYQHDGNPKLPADRKWNELEPYWQDRYRANAQKMVKRVDVTSAEVAAEEEDSGSGSPEA